MQRREVAWSVGLGTCVLLLICVQSGVEGQTSSSWSCSYWTSWQDYYSGWYEKEPQYAYHGMYPFGTGFCDTNATSQDKSQGIDIYNTFPINFYGTIYDNVLISPSGFLTLNTSSQFNFPTYQQGIQLPNQKYPTGGVDPPMICPFYGDIKYYTGNGDPSQISYRVLNPKGVSGVNQSIQLGMLQQLTRDIQAASLGAMWFQAQWGIIVTYYNVSQDSSTCSQTIEPCLRNTFQVAVATDGTNTYAIYNYFNITWVGTSIQYCTNSGGNSTTTQPCLPAQMGFNSGFARGFTSLPYAGTDQAIDIDSLSGTNVTGRWVYTISGDIVHHGGCTNDTSLGNSGTWPLTISPLFGPMFGGNVVNVSGPCFLKGANIKCRFGSVVTNGYYWGNMMQAMCVQPMLYQVGPIDLSVSIDGGQNYYFSTTYTVMQQEKVPELGVTVLNTNNNWLKPTTMTLTWNPANLTTEWGNVVTIQLMGYSNKNWQVLYTFVFEAQNTGTYTFTYNNNMCYNQNTHKICAYYSLGAFRVSLSNWQWDYRNPISMWSNPVPLAWFNVDQVSSNEGSGWSHDNCRSWYKNNTFQMNHLTPCPCTLNQSYVDMGFVPTTDCNLNNYNQPGGCPRNQGAMACYESTNISTSGSNTRCCYNLYGNLLYSEDSINGSISQASDPSGMFPYMDSPKIPSISHWENDLLPYYYCCVWQHNPYDCYNIFMISRPTQDCKNYNVPGHATAYGDPHFITMDGTAYAFNGYGEFWLLQITNAQVAGGTVSFSLQGRFQQPYNQTWGQIQATVMTAAAMQLNGGTVVTVMSNLWGTQERLLVYVNSTLLNFTSQSQWWQEYPDFFIVNNDQTGAYSNFSVLFRIGIGVNIAWKTGVMEMFVTVPAMFMRATGGLFGYWNGNPNDDLIPRNGNGQPVSPTDANSVFNSFGWSWVVLPTETIFTYVYRAQLNYNYYYRKWFVPWLNVSIPTNSPASSSTVQNICFNDQACVYDYYVTANATVAADTHAITMWDQQIRQMGATKYSCGWLEAPDSTKDMPVSYMAGSQVTITGCMSGFMMTGSNIRTFTCQVSGTTAVWSSPVSFYCQYLNGQPPPAVQAAIAVPICVVGSVGIVLLIIFLCRWRKRKERREGRREKRAERREERHMDSAIPPEAVIPLEEKKEVVDGAILSATRPAYNNIVTGPALSESYIDRNSRSSTPSKMSVNTGVSNVPNGGAVPPMRAPPRSRTPSQGYPADASRVGTPAQGVNRTITYSTDPGRSRELVLTVQTQVPGPMPYQYPVAGRQSPYDVNRAENYYSRKYAPSPASMHDNDSEV